jgi:hypothetical protein
MRRSKTSVHHWRYEDGLTCPNPGMPKGMGRLDPPPRGWYCWIYPEDDDEFRSWMKDCCPQADITYRFNSGDPMWTVYITDEQEALMFKLKWST